MRPSRSSRRRLNGGFTLLEILVAFAIMALVIGSSLQLFSTNLNSVRIGADYTLAISLARSKLDELAAQKDWSEGEDEGQYPAEDTSEPARFLWRTVLERYGGDDLGSVEELPVIPFIGSAEVRWTEGSRTRRVSLSTLLLGVDEQAPPRRTPRASRQSTDDDDDE